MLKTTRHFKNQILNYASTINVAIRETGSSEPCDHASTVAMLLTSCANLKGLAQAKIIKKSVILFRVLNMTI